MVAYSVGADRIISASDMHSQGISDKVAADRGGWSGTQTMRQVYQHSFTEERRAADKLMNSRYSEMFKRTHEEKATQDATQHDENNVDT